VELCKRNIYGNQDGSLNQTVPTRNGFGDYTLHGSWGSDEHLLTECFAGGCDNSTLTAVTSNHMELTDNHASSITRYNTSDALMGKAKPNLKLDIELNGWI
jgi:hypothetical protein